MSLDDGIKVTMVAGDPIEVEIVKAVAVGATNGVADGGFSLAVGPALIGRAVALAVKAYREEMASMASVVPDAEPEDDD